MNASWAERLTIFQKLHPFFFTVHIRKLLTQMINQSRLQEIDFSQKKSEKNLEAWGRLEQIIMATHHTINSFAKLIGLPRGENLYQIKRGNNRISLDVALRINKLYPQYSLEWLVFGRNNSVLEVPIYSDFGAISSLQTATAEGAFKISTLYVHQPQFAVKYKVDTSLGPGNFNNAIILFRKSALQRIQNGRMYYVISALMRGLVIIIQNDLNHIKVKNALSNEQYTTIIPTTELGDIWEVCEILYSYEKSYNDLQQKPREDVLNNGL